MLQRSYGGNVALLLWKHVGGFAVFIRAHQAPFPQLMRCIGACFPLGSLALSRNVRQLVGQHTEANDCNIDVHTAQKQ